MSLIPNVYKITKGLNFLRFPASLVFCCVAGGSAFTYIYMLQRQVLVNNCYCHIVITYVCIHSHGRA